MRQHNLKVTGSLQINGENVISASQLSTLSASINSKIEGLNPSQIGTGSYTASISPNGTFSVNTNTIITGSLSVSSFNSSGSIIAASGFTGSLSGSVFGLGNTVSFSSSVSSDLVNLESKSASVDISITNINSFTASNANTSLNSKTGSYATTGSNTFYGTQVFSGSVFIATDLIVQGSSSIQYISASSVSIGTNIVQLNTATPGIRFAGLAVQDSGSSAGITGSMLWDSLCNRWIYSNPSTIGYSGGMLLSGPRASTLGTETTLTCNYIAKSGGGDHLYDSCIIDDGTSVCVNANLKGSGTACFSGNICTPTLSATACINIGTDVSLGSRLSIQSPNDQAGITMYNTFDCNKWSLRTGTTGVNNKGFGIVDDICNLTRIQIDGAGNVGIGTTSPSAKLDVYAGADATSNLILWGQTIRNEGNGAATGYGAGLKLKISSDGTPNEVYKWAGVAAVAGTGYSNRTDLALYTNTASTANATEKVRITGDGYVGIGTCAPNEKLTVWTSSTTGLQTALRLNNPFGFNNLNTGTQIVFSQDRSVSEDLKQGIIAVGQADAGTSATSFMAFYTNSSGLGERLRITSIGRVGILTNDPKGLFEVGMTCAKTTFGGLLFNTLSVADNNWFSFFEPPGNWAGLTTMNWVAPNDFNRSGTAQVRWSYQNCSAALGPTTSIFNDSQNATATFRYAGGYLQACITGAGAGYNVQFTILGARGA